jgi:antitoxin Phd
MRQWQMQQAKAHLSEVVERAEREGPQEITKHGKARAVVLSSEVYARLAGNARPSLVEYLKSGPSWEGVDLERDKSPARDIDLE